MKHIYKYILMLIVSVLLLITGTAMAYAAAMNEELKYNSGIITCGYNFDNYETFSNWNIKNMNAYPYGIYISHIRFKDEYANDVAFYDSTDANFPKGHWDVLSKSSAGYIGERQSDVIRSQDLDLSSWYFIGPVMQMPRKGQVDFYWESYVPLAKSIPLQVNHVRTKKHLNKQGKLLGVTRTKNACKLREGSRIDP